MDAQTIGSRGYGTYEMRVDIVPNRTTALRHTIWLTQLDREGDRRVDAPTSTETVLTNRRIPGLEVHIPAGSKITDADGRPVRRLNLTAIPVDRPPFPLPQGVDVPAYFTVQPGRAYVSRGARVIYPNYHNLPPGQRVTFWNYDADDRGWYIYGQGEVTADGRQVVPDPGVRVWEFTGAMASTGQGAPDTGPNAGGGASAGDPVDLGTGLFVYQKVDLALPDDIPAIVERTYRPGDANAYTFGRGTTSPYDLRLVNVTSYTVAQLVLPDGGTVRYVRTSPGTGYVDAVYESRTTPGPWFGSIIRRTADGSGWELHRRDGTVYEFDSGYGPVTMITDPHGQQLTIARDRGSAGMPVHVTTPHGRWLRFSYDQYNRASKVRDNAGRTVSYTYDANSRLATVTDADGGTTAFAYDAAGQMTTVTDARGITFLRNRYDAAGRVAEQTLANGGSYLFDYTMTSGGRISTTRVTDPRGAVQEVAFDASGLPVRHALAVGSPEEQVTIYERDAASNLVSAVVDALNRRTTFAYDSDSNVTAVTSLAGTAQAETTRFTYGSNSRLRTVADPLGHTTTYGYDSSGRLVAITDPTNRQTSLAYNGSDARVSTLRDPAGNETRFSYRDGELRSIRDPLGNVTRRWTDAAGRTVSVTDPLGRTVRVAYSDADLVRSVTDSAGGPTAYRYDPNGNLVEVTDARGKSMRASYDTMDHAATWSDATGRGEQYERDSLGNITRITDRKGEVTSLRYDMLSRRTFAGFGATTGTGVEQFASTLASTYDAADRLVSVKDSAAGEVANRYDVHDRLESQATPNGVVSYAYDAAGRRTGMALNGDGVATYTYDDANRLTGIQQGGESVAVGYDEVGRPTSVQLPNAVTRRSSYDAAGRLTALQFDRAGGRIGDLQYAYNAAGQRIAGWGSLHRTRLPAPIGSATYDDANRLATRDGAAVTWDHNGNLITDGTSTYGWDARGQLSTVTGPGMAASFAYDALGRRSGRLVGVDERRFVLDGWNVLQELGGESSATRINGLGLDQTFASMSAGETKTVLSDALGSTVALTGLVGDVIEEFSYGPFGESGDAGTYSYQYTGRENDGTGLLHYRNRYYSPRLKRFISEDPIRLAGGDVNLYAYVWNDPLRWTDPLGLHGDLPPIPPEYDDAGFEEKPHGARFNPKTGESWHPDDSGHGPHHDYRKRPFDGWRRYPDGRWEPKAPRPGPKPSPRGGGGAASAGGSPAGEPGTGGGPFGSLEGGGLIGRK